MSSPSPAEAGTRVAVVGCGAITTDVLTRLAGSLGALGADVDIHPLPPLLHNHPERITAAVRARVADLAGRYDHVVVGYADCGTYGALDDLCAELGTDMRIERLPGRHCYDLLAGASEVDTLMADEPGTYLLTDFLVASFDRTVWRELGLDRFPELRDDYFQHYQRVVWLAGKRTPDLERAARRAAARLGLPLEIRPLMTGAPMERDDSTKAMHDLAYN